MKACLALAGGVLALAAAPALAQGLITPPALPPMIVPVYPELGGTSVPSGGGNAGNADGGVDGGGAVASDTGPASGSTALASLSSQSYGASALAAAQSAGISADALAGVAQAESNFRNVPTANASSSATGVWQITSGTWNDVNQKYGLGYTATDRTDPAAQATVASYLLKEDAAAVSTATGQPATVAQTYGAYVFGPTSGSAIATADASTPLSNLVSSQALANNGMTGWTVGQFNSTMAQRLGSAAGSSVIPY